MLFWTPMLGDIIIFWNTQYSRNTVNLEQALSRPVVSKVEPVEGRVEIPIRFVIGMTMNKNGVSMNKSG